MAIGSEAPRDGNSPVSQLLPPGDITSPPNRTIPPASDGRIFLIENRHRLVVPAARQMPTDEVTGLPHVILPIEIDFIDNQGGAINYHHHFYNRRHPDLEGPQGFTAEQLAHPEVTPLEALAGLAVRISRGQRLPVEVHQYAHKRFPVGPYLPHTLDEKFITAVKACAGVVSRWAIDITAPSEQLLVYMNDDLFTAVTSRKLLGIEHMHHDGPAGHRKRILGTFFLRYAITQDLSHVSERKVDEFLNTPDEQQRMAAGNFILREAMEVGIAPIIPMYRDLRAQGMVQPGKPDVRTTVWKCVHPHRNARVLPALRERLAMQLTNRGG